MSEHIHPGFHPDADSLNAFIEGVLPEHERLECLAHLADCPRCREIVYLAREPVAPAPVPATAGPVPFWKRWFAPIPVLAAAMVCVLLVSIGVYRLIQTKRVEPVLTAVATPAIEPPAPLSDPLKEVPAARSAKSIATRQLAPPAERRAIIQNAPTFAAPVLTAPRAAPVSPSPPPPPPSRPVSPAVSAPAAFSLADQAPLLKTESGEVSNPAPGIVMAGIAGTVTDPAGVVVPGASVTVRRVTGTSSIDTRTDGKGEYNLAGLAPGRYEVQIVSPGFKQATTQIDVQPQLVARADSKLDIGAATETVTVTAAAPALMTESASVSVSRAKKARPSAEVSALPSKLPVSTTASSEKLMLAGDSAGTLFLSKNSGKSWKSIKPRWQGKVVRLDLAHDVGAVFQLTTDSGSVWLSRDGAHWNSTPSPR
jgi:Carboxypeptidase regulatory-like domain/Putative zinc-finger